MQSSAAKKEIENLNDDETTASRKAITLLFARQRQKLGLSQEKVADIAGISRIAYARIESGEIDFKCSTLLHIAHALEFEIKIVPSDSSNSFNKKLQKIIELVESFKE